VRAHGNGVAPRRHVNGAWAATDAQVALLVLADVDAVDHHGQHAVLALVVLGVAADDLLQRMII